MVIKISTRSPRVKNFLFDYLPTGIQIKNHIFACHQIIQFLLRSFCDIAPASVQRPKKSELSGWQLSTRKNFPDEVRKLFSRQKTRKSFSRPKSVRKLFLGTFGKSDRFRTKKNGTSSDQIKILRPLL